MEEVLKPNLHCTTTTYLDFRSLGVFENKFCMLQFNYKIMGRKFNKTILSS